MLIAKKDGARLVLFFCLELVNLREAVSINVYILRSMNRYCKKYRHTHM